MKLYTITNDAYGYVNTIFIKGNSIIALSENGANSMIELRCNNSHVLKFNKKSISTYNVEMLVYLLQHNEQSFIGTFSFIFDYELFNTDTFKIHNVTISQFYNSFNSNMNDFISFFQECSPETRQTIIYNHICFNHEQKMSGVISLSTYVGLNKFCLARCNNCDNAICKYCYAASLTGQRFHLKMKLIRIMAILTSVELSENDIPKIDANIFPFFRFESFGDVNNVLQFNNMNLIAFCNPDINFTLWSKNPGIIQNALDNGTKQATNLVIGLSSLYLNTPELNKAKRYSFIRFLFTVYDDNYIREHNIKINCGAKHCLTCGICYKALHENKNGNLFIINERKK